MLHHTQTVAVKLTKCSERVQVVCLYNICVCRNPNVFIFLLINQNFIFFLFYTCVTGPFLYIAWVIFKWALSSRGCCLQWSVNDSCSNTVHINHQIMWWGGELKAHYQMMAVMMMLWRKIQWVISVVTASNEAKHFFFFFSSLCFLFLN